jgi:hypothetical protein
MMVNRDLGSPSQCGGPDRLFVSRSGGFLTFESDLIICIQALAVGNSRS